MLDLQPEYEEGVLVLNPAGRIDGANARAYEAALLDRISAGQTKILLNCEAVEPDCAVSFEEPVDRQTVFGHADLSQTAPR